MKSTDPIDPSNSSENWNFPPRRERERATFYLFLARARFLEIDFYFRRLRKKQISELLKVLVASTVGLSCLSSRNFPKIGRRERSFSVPSTCPQNDTRVWHDPREPSILRNDNQSLDGVAHRLIGSQDCLKLILFHEREGEDSPFPSKKISLSRPPLVGRSIISSRFFGKIASRTRRSSRFLLLLQQLPCCEQKREQKSAW